MPPNRHMTTNSKVERFTDSASWFRRKVAQLGAALRRLPPHRRPPGFVRPNTARGSKAVTLITVVNKD